jgi:PAS domain S-box-containing protein
MSDQGSQAKAERDLPATPEQDWLPAHAQHVREHLELVLDNVPVLVAYFESEGIRCVFANRLYAQVHGWQVHEVIGRHCKDIIGEQAWQTIEPHVKQVLAGHSVRYERELTRPDGSHSRIDVSLLPHLIETATGSQMVGTFVLIHDITARHQAEQHVLTREQRAHRFIEASSEGIVFFEDGIILDCNEALAQMLQRSREALIGSPVVEVFAPEDRNFAAKHIHLGRDTPYPARIPLPDGTWLDVEIRGKLVQAEGRLASVAAVRDVSQLTHISEALLRSQSRYRSLVENSDQAAIFIQDRRVVYSNPAAQRMFELSEAQMRGTESIYLLHPEDRAYALMRRKQMIAGDPDRTAVLRTMSPPSEQMELGSKVGWVRLHGSILEWDGRAGVLIFLTDITALRESEEQMRKALAQERELGDLKTRFVSMASHEFRTPLATIQTSSELLQHYHDRMSETERTEAVVDIQRAVQRMQVMMDSFLAFGRLSSGQTRFAPQKLPLKASLQKMVDEARAGPYRQYAVSVEVQSPVTMFTQLMLDEILLGQIVINLVTNACKYSAVGQQVRVFVRSEAGALGQELVIDVLDQGIGIPADEMPLLFVSFHRASNAGTVPGTGLGLAIVDRAVRAHGGRVKVYSEVGQGSRFSVYLPWKPA